MKIVDVKSIIISIPFKKPEIWAWGIRKGISNIIIEITTDEGLTGLGEISGFLPVTVLEQIVQETKQLLIGETPFCVEEFTKRFYAVGGWQYYRRIGNHVLCGIETALWDLIGKICKQPILNFFGGKVRSNIEYMYYLLRDDIEKMSCEAKAAVKEGYRTIYFKVGVNPKEDKAMVKAVREAIGDDIKLRVDANGVWSVGTAISILKHLEKYNLEFIEQPVVIGDLEGMKQVKNATGIPVAANESSWTGYDVLEIIKRKAADIVLIEPCQDGGLLAFKKTAAMAELEGLPVIKHSFGELGISTCASAHVISTASNFIFANQTYIPFLTDDVIQRDAYNYNGGILKLNTENPGIGVSLNREKIIHYNEFYNQKGNLNVSTEITEDYISWTPKY